MSRGCGCGCDLISEEREVSNILHEVSLHIADLTVTYGELRKFAELARAVHDDDEQVLMQINDDGRIEEFKCIVPTPEEE